MFRNMNQSHSDMRRYLLGQRFVDPAVETDFRAWRREAAFPVMWLGMWAASLSWLAVPWAMGALAPEIWPEVRGPVLYGFIPGYMCLTLAFFIHNVRRHALLVATVANACAGFTMIWLGYLVGDSVGATVAATVLILFYAPFMRLPPENALVASAPYMLTTLALAIAHRDDLVLPGERFAYYIVPSMSLLTVLLVCHVLEYLMRTSYTRECLIETQRSALENASRQIRRYVPNALADEILGGHGEAIDTPQRRRITILFCDLVGFTEAADRLDPESLTQILGDYMATMAQAIEAQGGTLNEFAGDGLMALFGAPREMAPEAQVRQAVQAACAMQQRLPELNRAWRKLGLDTPMDCRIGINTGVVSVGSYGSEGRMTYTAIGLQTNIAARLEAAAAPGEILLSEASWALVEGEIKAQPRGEVECKGVHYPVKAYAVIKTEATA